MQHKKTDDEKFFSKPMSATFLLLLSFFDKNVNSRMKEDNYIESNIKFKITTESITFGLLSKFANDILNISFDESNYSKIWKVLENLKIIKITKNKRETYFDTANERDFDLTIRVGRPMYIFKINYEILGGMILDWLKLDYIQKEYVCNIDGFNMFLGKLFSGYLADVINGLIVKGEYDDKKFFVEKKEEKYLVRSKTVKVKDYVEKLLNDSINTNEFTVNNLLLGFFIKRLYNPRYFLDYSSLLDYSKIQGDDKLSFQEDKLLKNHPFYYPSQIIYIHCFENLRVKINPFILSSL